MEQLVHQAMVVQRINGLWVELAFFFKSKVTHINFPNFFFLAKLGYMAENDTDGGRKVGFFISW